MKKKTSHAFGKKIFFLGRDENNINHWLEQAKWDCDWYWGFGYIETYTNNANPDRSKDISCHTHFDSLIFNKKSHTINDILKTPLSDSEAWELSDLLKSFYTLKDTSGIFHQGNSHFTDTKKVNLSNSELYRHINKVLMPQIFKRIYEILTPQGEDVFTVNIPKIKVEA